MSQSCKLLFIISTGFLCSLNHDILFRADNRCMTKEERSVSDLPPFKLHSNYQKVTVCILTSFNTFFKTISSCGVMRFFFFAPIPLMQSEECRKFRWCIFTYQSRTHLSLQNGVHEKLYICSNMWLNLRGRLWLPVMSRIINLVLGVSHCFNSWF